MKKLLLITLVSALSLSSTGCLKTRAQLRDDSEEREVARPVSVQPAQEVHPQGQYVIDEIKAEFTRLEGKVEDIERSQKGMAAAAKNPSEDLKKLEARIQQLETSQIALQESLSKAHEASVVSDPTALFKKAQAQYQDEDYEGTVETLALYLKAPKLKKSEDGVFLRGEAFLKLKDYKKAIVEFSKFPEKFTRSSRMPEALYKIGFSFDALGMKEDAKGFYQELVEKYPKSPEAKKVRKKVK